MSRGDQLAAVVGPAPGADGQDLALLGLLFGGVGDDEARRRPLFRLVRADNDSIVEWLQVHDVVASVGKYFGQGSPASTLTGRLLTIATSGR